MVEGTCNHSMIGVKHWMDIHILYKVLGGASDDQVKSVVKRILEISKASGSLLEIIIHVVIKITTNSQRAVGVKCEEFQVFGKFIQKDIKTVKPLSFEGGSR